MANAHAYLWQRITLQTAGQREQRTELKYVPESVRKTWGSAIGNVPPERAASNRAQYQFYEKLAKLINGSGAGVLAGTDTGDPWVVPGFALHDELAAMVAAGFTPAEALATATLAPGRYFDLEATQGSIAKGKAANLLLLNADPLADIHNTRSIAAVIANGRVLNRNCLDSLLAGKQTQCPTPPVWSVAPTPSPEKPTPAPKHRKRTTR